MLMDAALAENLPRSLTLPTGSPTDGFPLRIIIASLIISGAFIPSGFGAEEPIKYTFPVWWRRRTTRFKIRPALVI